MFLRKLVLSNLAQRKPRVALTVTAIALSVSLVVAVTSGYASIEAAAFRFLNSYLGSTDAQISRMNDPHGGVRESLEAELQKDPQVKGVTGRLEMEAGLVDAAGSPVKGRPAQVIGIRRPGDTRVESMTVDEGAWFDTADGNVAVIDQVAARLLKDGSENKSDTGPTLHVGDSFTLPTSPTSKVTLKIVGIVHKPAILAAQQQTIYMPIETLQKAMGGDVPQVTRIMVNLNDGVDSALWGQRWKKQLAASDPNLKLRVVGDNRNDLDNNLQGLHILSYLGGTVSMLAATFIVFSALSMGVSERQRTLAMLRAIGAVKRQIGWLVVLEGLLLAGLGVAIGVPLGLGWMAIIGWKFADVFVAGVVIEKIGILFAITASMLAALAASLLPAVSAMRLDPLEAMSPLASRGPQRFPWIALIAGLVLISFDPILGFGDWGRWIPAMHLSPVTASPEAVAKAIHFYGHFAIGLPSAMIGFFLIAPAFVFVLERVAGPIIATLFGLRFAMLRQQLSGGLWRAAGTCAALMVGLSVLVVMQTQGHTMLSSWQLPTNFPDIFMVSYKFGGLNDAEQAKLHEIKGIKDGQILPIAIAAPELGSNIFALAGAAAMPDATMFLGVDPDLAMKMLDLDFRQGNARDAAAELKKGRHVIITEEFRQLKGLQIGSTLPLKTTSGLADFTVCGVIWSPGIDVMVSMFDMGRQFDQRTAASVFGSMDDARKDFGVSGAYLFAANLQTGFDKAELLKEIKEQVGSWGMRAGDVRQIKYKIQEGFYRLLLLVSTVAFAAMAVASLGVANTIIASIRSRQWQFGILRSIGVTRSGLLRLVLAEATLLGVVGATLGVVAGLVMSVNANRLTLNVLGSNLPLRVPWGMVWFGVGLVMLVALLASLGPAIRVARRDPLSLLQAGRSAT